MKKFLYTIIFLGIIIFPSISYAVNVYTHLDNSFYFTFNNTTYQEVGSFTLGESHVMDQAQYQISANQQTQCTAGVMNWRIAISTTTDTSITPLFIIDGDLVQTSGSSYSQFTGTYDGSYTLSAGTYYIFAMPLCNGGEMRLAGNGASVYGVISDSSGFTDILSDTTTRIISFTPSGTRATSTSNTLYTDFYYNSADFISNSYIRIKYVRQEDLNASVANSDLLWTTLDLNDTITDGYATLSTTTGSLGLAGNYLVKVELRKPSTFWSTTLSYFNPFSNLDPDIIISKNFNFVYGTSTNFEQFQGQLSASSQAFQASSTSVALVKEYCSFSTAFAFSDCVNSLFIPSITDIQNDVMTIKNNIIIRFPLGYFSDFISIISTTSVSSLPVIDAYLPDALQVGHNDHIYLSLTGVLDPVLNATTSIFTNVSASSTETFYQITERYWEIFLNIGVLFYILGRILGAAMTVRGRFGKRGALSDTNSQDDSYRLKEYLYNHRNK